MLQKVKGCSLFQKASPNIIAYVEEHTVKLHIQTISLESQLPV